jgi:hypothetical protein
LAFVSSYNDVLLRVTRMGDVIGGMKSWMRRMRDGKYRYSWILTGGKICLEHREADNLSLSVNPKSGPELDVDRDGSVKGATLPYSPNQA